MLVYTHYLHNMDDCVPVRGIFGLGREAVMGRSSVTEDDGLRVCVSFEESRISRGCLEWAYELLVPVRGCLRDGPRDRSDENSDYRKGRSYDPGSDLCARV
jgi:hypothetical protein